MACRDRTSTKQKAVQKVVHKVVPVQYPRWPNIATCLEDREFWNFVQANKEYQHNFLYTVSEKYFQNELFVFKMFEVYGPEVVTKIPPKYLTREIWTGFFERFYPVHQRQEKKDSRENEQDDYEIYISNDYEFYRFLFLYDPKYEHILVYLKDVPKHFLTTEFVDVILTAQHGPHRIFILFYSGLIPFQLITDSTVSKVFDNNSPVHENLKSIPLQFRFESVCRTGLLFAYDEKHPFAKSAQDVYFQYVPVPVLLSRSFYEFAKQIVPQDVHKKVFDTKILIPDLVPPKEVIRRIIIRENYFYNLIDTSHFFKEEILVAYLQRSHNIYEKFFEDYGLSKFFDVSVLEVALQNRDVVYELLYYMQQNGKDPNCIPFEHIKLTEDLVEFAFQICTTSKDESYNFYIKCLPEHLRTTNLWNLIMDYMEPFRNRRKNPGDHSGVVYFLDDRISPIPVRFQTDELFVRLYYFNTSFFKIFDKKKLSNNAFPKILCHKNFSMKEAKELPPHIFDMDFIYEPRASISKRVEQRFEQHIEQRFEHDKHDKHDKHDEHPEHLEQPIWKQLINNACEFLLFFPKERLSDEIINYAMERSGIALKYLPEDLRTVERCIAAVHKREQAMNDVPKAHRKEVRAYFKEYSEKLKLGLVSSARIKKVDIQQEKLKRKKQQHNRQQVKIQKKRMQEVDNKKREQLEKKYYELQEQLRLFKQKESQERKEMIRKILSEETEVEKEAKRKQNESV